MPLPQEVRIPAYFKDDLDRRETLSRRLKLEIDYDGINTDNHKTEFVMKFNPSSKSFEIEDGRAN